MVNPEFEPLWFELDGIADLTLGIPDVVRGELLFQQTSSALRTLARAQAKLTTLSATTGHRHQLVATEELVKSQVQDRFDAWIKRMKARVLPAPLRIIDWQALVESAIWRKPPFTLDKSSDVEKGFRDALILETTLHVLAAAEVPRVAFICGDKLLAHAAMSRANEKDRFIVHDSITSFASYLRLAQETLTDQFVKSVVERAAKSFFEKGERRTLYYSAGLRERAETEFSQSLRVNEPSAEFLFSVDPENSYSPWVQVGRQRIRIGNPQFLRIEDPETFFWRSPITTVRAYQRERPKNGFARLFGAFDQNVLTLRVDVDWHADVDADGTFSNGVIDGLTEGSRVFEPATSMLIARYDLKGLTSSGLLG